MKYFKSLLLTACALFTLAACNTDDLRDDVNDLKDRVESLEAQVNLLNENMTAIRVLLEGGKSITNLKNENGTYTLTLSDGQTISLTQGKTGEIGYPTISVDSNGYWTVNGAILKDAQGNSVKAAGSDGKTPQFRLTGDDKHWQVSYDGTTWTDVKDENNELVSAVTGSDKFFADVKESTDGEFFMVKLQGATEYIQIPIVKSVISKIDVPTDGSMVNGKWQIGYGKEASTTIKIKGDNIITTAPAGWTVSVGTPDANNVATLTIKAPTKTAANALLSRATADNSSDVTIQANTGANWAVDKIQVEAIEIIDSYYDYYMNDGGTITFQGANANDKIEVNKANFGNAIHITDNTTSIAADGVYFIDPGLTVTYNGNGNKNLILISNDPKATSTVNVDVQIKFTQDLTKESHFLCKNISLVGTSTLNNQIFTYNTDNNPMKYVIFDQCQITNIAGKQLVYLSSNTRSIENFIMMNSKFMVPAAESQKHVLSLGTSTATYANIVFKNNVFYCKSGKVTAFALVQGSGATVTNMTVDNNTFINVHTSTTGYVYVDNMSTLNLNHNIIWSDIAEGGNSVFLRAVKGSSDGTGLPTTGSCTNNIAKRGDDTKTWQVFFGGKKTIPGMEEIVLLTTNPFQGGTFDLATGKFIPNEEYTGYGASIN